MVVILCIRLHSVRFSSFAFSPEFQCSKCPRPTSATLYPPLPRRVSLIPRHPSFFASRLALHPDRRLHCLRRGILWRPPRHPALSQGGLIHPSLTPVHLTPYTLTLSHTRCFLNTVMHASHTLCEGQKTACAYFAQRSGAAVSRFLAAHTRERRQRFLTPPSPSPLQPPTSNPDPAYENFLVHRKGTGTARRSA